MSGRPEVGRRPAFLDEWQPLANVLTPTPHMLVFYRGFWCDYCKQQLADLVNIAPALGRLGVNIVAITTDVASEHQDDLAHTRSSFPILEDSGGTLIGELDLVDPFEFRPVPVSLPAVFLLDSAGVVRFQYVGRSPEDRPKTELLLLAAERLTQGKN